MDTIMGLLDEMDSVLRHVKSEGAVKSDFLSTEVDRVLRLYSLLKAVKIQMDEVSE